MLNVKKYLTNGKLSSILSPTKDSGGRVATVACVGYDFHCVQSRSLKIEGTLAWISAFRRRFLSTICAKYLLLLVDGLQRCLDVTKLDDNEAEEMLINLRRMNELYEKALPLLMDSKRTWLTREDINRFVDFGSYLEDVIDSLAIRTDKKADAKIRELPQIMHQLADKLPDWRDCANFAK